MTLLHEITVYKYMPVSDGYGGQLPATPVLQTLAPAWANIEQRSGDDLVLNERWTTRNNYTITVNERPGFKWERNMFIVSANYGILDIEGITETVRKRLWELSAVYVDGVDDVGSGTPAIVAGLTTLYYTVPADSATLSIPAIEGAEIYLLFRDNDNKQVVSSNPQVNDVMVSGSTLSLVTDDIFYQGERITILYI